ncbi:MAG: glycosyltransferase family 2 protein [Acidobacteria bacterium]|nr:glycosyltransferase family 2 protein [Acidobacteriota bacterium]
MSEPDVSIVIVNWNAKEMLRACLDSLASQPASLQVEIIVVDNGSHDGSQAMLGRDFANVILIEPDGNIGYVKANNVGLRRATGRYVFFLNNDTLTGADALKELIRFMDTHPEAGAASGRILNPDGTDQGCARKLPTLANGLFGRRSVLTRLWPSNPWSRRYMLGWQQTGVEPFEVEILSSAALLLPRELAVDMRGMDEAFELYWVDAEMCARVRERGLRVYCVPRSEIVHFEGQGGSTRTFRSRMRSTLAFHRDAFRAFVRIRHLGISHPAAIAAAAALGVRAALLIGLQFLRPHRATSSGMRTSPVRPS